jgi:hypothetical protein
MLTVIETRRTQQKVESAQGANEFRERRVVLRDDGKARRLGANLLNLRSRIKA